MKDEKDRKRIGANIKKMREKLQLSQADLGYLLDVHKSTVAHWESGKRNPAAATYLRIMGLDKELNMFI